MRIHWRLPHGSDPPSPLGDCSLPDLARQIPFCREAEALGFDSLLIDFGIDKADPLLLAAALGMATTRMRFIIACRSGLTAPTMFVQQLNTLSTLIGGRFALNVVAGSTPDEQRRYGDWAEHDERWERTDEFLTIARNLWRGGEHDFDGRWYRISKAAVKTPFRAHDGRQAPEIYVGGSSPAALAVARKHADCSLMPVDVPARIAAQVAPILAAGKEAGIRASVIARRTRAEALEAAESFRTSAPVDAPARQRVHVDRSDSQMIRGAYARAADEWPLPWLWKGAVRAYGAMSVAIVGSYDEVADALLAYRAAGVAQCILAGTPKLDEMRIFGAEVMGRVRAGVSA
ncbi:MAG TPA: LLM class flavin-dependent oxidoreductase [Thermoanaerobaculia bacterium]|nr:LLM class flavin-dependent oxidoreductase [Thermoanaerobaculia bacterium]